MIYKNVFLIAAIGRSGQLGIGSELPWPKQSDDLKWFSQMTTGDVLVFGGATLAANQSLYDMPERLTVRDDREIPPGIFMRQLVAKHPHRRIWICGGAKTYRRLLPYVYRSYFNHIDYDGPADVFFPWDAFSQMGTTDLGEKMPSRLPAPKPGKPHKVRPPKK